VTVPAAEGVTATFKGATSSCLRPGALAIDVKASAKPRRIVTVWLRVPVVAQARLKLFRHGLLAANRTMPVRAGRTRVRLLIGAAIPPGRYSLVAKLTDDCGRSAIKTRAVNVPRSTR